MRFDIITLMPELYGPHLSLGVTRRAYEDQAMAVRLWPLRDYGQGPYRRVDDRPFGGGPGMVLLADPLERCLQDILCERPDAPLIHFTPTGRRLDQAFVRELAQGPGAVMLCGRYEGVDQRFLDRHPWVEVSLGDFVLSGGDIAALALLDAVARLQPGVLQDPASHEQDSFEGDGLLDCPHYSRPEVWSPASSSPVLATSTSTSTSPEQAEPGAPLAPGCDDAERVGAGAAVPAVLLSGHHAQIARWRREQSLRLTALRRPDLLEAARRAGRLSAEDERYLESIGL